MICGKRVKGLKGLAMTVLLSKVLLQEKDFCWIAMTDLRSADVSRIGMKII